MQGLTIPSGVEFVPLIRDASDVTTSNLATAKASGTTLLGFNEPNLGTQVYWRFCCALPCARLLLHAKRFLVSHGMASLSNMDSSQSPVIYLGALNS